MSTDYTAFKDGENELITDSRRKLEMHIVPFSGSGSVWSEADPNSMHFSSGRLTEDQIVEVGVGILGPAFYFTDSEEELVKKIKEEFRRRGFTHKFT